MAKQMTPRAYATTVNSMKRHAIQALNNGDIETARRSKNWLGTEHKTNLSEKLKVQAGRKSPLAKTPSFLQKKIDITTAALKEVVDAFRAKGVR